MKRIVVEIPAEAAQWIQKAFQAGTERALELWSNGTRRADGHLQQGSQVTKVCTIKVLDARCWHAAAVETEAPVKKEPLELTHPVKRKRKHKSKSKKSCKDKQFQKFWEVQQRQLVMMQQQMTFAAYTPIAASATAKQLADAAAEEKKQIVNNQRQQNEVAEKAAAAAEERLRARSPKEKEEEEQAKYVRKKKEDREGKSTTMKNCRKEGGAGSETEESREVFRRELSKAEAKALDESREDARLEKEQELKRKRASPPVRLVETRRHSSPTRSPSRRSRSRHRSQRIPRASRSPRGENMDIRDQRSKSARSAVSEAPWIAERSDPSSPWRRKRESDKDAKQDVRIPALSSAAAAAAARREAAAAPAATPNVRITTRKKEKRKERDKVKRVWRPTGEGKKEERRSGVSLLSLRV